MKIFCYTEFDMSCTVKIVDDKDYCLILRGKRCDDHMPAYGIKLDKDSKKRFIKWLEHLKAERESQESCS